MARKYISVKQKETVFKRAQGLCEYCKTMQKYSPQIFVIEHIIPISKSGKSILKNLALACGECNARKYNKIEAFDNVKGVYVSLFHPRKQNWKDHFEWSEDFTKVIGITSVGRVTIETLKTNRQWLLNIRTITQLTGEHPPK